MSITTVLEFNSKEERNITTNISYVWYVVYGVTNHTDWYTAHKTYLHNLHTPRKNLSLLLTTDQRQRKQGGRRKSESTRLQPVWPGFESRRRRQMWFEFLDGFRASFERISLGDPLRLSTFPHSSNVRNGKWKTIGTLSNYDDDGSENITKKMNLRPFKLYRVYLEPLNSSNVGDFSWSWILKGFIHVEIEKGKFVVVCPRPPHNVA